MYKKIYFFPFGNGKNGKIGKKIKNNQFYA